MKCLKNCIFMLCGEIRTDLPCRCFISKKKVNLGETCPYENLTVTMLNMEVNYKEEKPKPDKRLRHIEIFGDKNKSFDLDEVIE